MGGSELSAPQRFAAILTMLKWGRPQLCPAVGAPIETCWALDISPRLFLLIRGRADTMFDDGNGVCLLAMRENRRDGIRADNSYHRRRISAGLDYLLCGMRYGFLLAAA